MEINGKHDNEKIVNLSELGKRQEARRLND